MANSGEGLVEYVHVIRHALPVGVRGVERPDPPLSEHGRQQAELVSQWWGGRPVSGIVTSDMARAMQTAEPTAASLGVKCEVEPDLAEIDHGVDFYLPVVDPLVAVSHPKVAAWRELSAGWDMEGQYVAFQKVVVAAFERVTNREGPHPLLVFAHGGIVSALTREILGHASFHGLVPDFASITTLRRRPDGRWMVVAFSQTQHLESLPLPGSASGVLDELV